ncbi:hypothetical protein AgCh_002205 [Apium graveolens]
MAEGRRKWIDHRDFARLGSDMGMGERNPKSQIGVSDAHKIDGKNQQDVIQWHTRKKIQHLASPKTKIVAARELDRKSRLDYAMMTGGDVAPLGSQAVMKIYQLFDWAKKSNRGLFSLLSLQMHFFARGTKSILVKLGEVQSVPSFFAQGISQKT